MKTKRQKTLNPSGPKTRGAYKSTNHKIIVAYFIVGKFSSSLSKSTFVAKLKKLIPEVGEYIFVNGGNAGIRAQTISPHGELNMNFIIIKENSQIHLLNAPLPGATASLSIAKYIIKNYI